jgi:hypothetical protein
MTIDSVQHNHFIINVVRKGILHKHVYLPPLVSVEATGVCTPIDKRQILLAAVYKSPGRAWIAADIIERLNLRVNPFWHVMRMPNIHFGIVQFQALQVRNAPVASPLGKRAPGTHWIGRWVGSTTGLDIVEKGKILHCRKSNPSHSVRSPSVYRLSYPDSRCLNINI